MKDALVYPDYAPSKALAARVKEAGPDLVGSSCRTTVWPEVRRLAAVAGAGLSHLNFALWERIIIR